MKLAAAVLFVVSTSALAGGPTFSTGRDSVSVKTNGPTDNYNDFPNVAKSVAKSESTAFSSAIGEGGNASAIAHGGSGGMGGGGGMGGSGGSGGAGGVGYGGDSSSGGNSLSVNEVHPDKITIRQVPSFGVAAISPTANCMGAASATLATGFFGIGGGKSYVNKHCVYQELARFYATSGDMAVANEILCQSEYMKGVSVCRGR